MADAPQPGRSEPATDTEQITTVVDASGRLVVPARFRQALRFRERQRVVVSLNGKTLEVQTAEDALDAAVEYVQALARKYDTHADGGVDAFLAERRREAKAEEAEAKNRAAGRA